MKNLPKIRLIFYFILLVVIIISCKKENDENQNIPETINPPPTNIYYYHDFTPDTIITSPFHGYDSLFIDVNNDSISDIRFNVSNYTYWYGPHEYEAYQINVMTLDTLYLKLIKNNFHCAVGPCQSSYDSSMYINFLDDTYYYITLLFNEHGFACNCYFQSSYIGFVYYKNGNKYLGWIELQIPNETHLVVKRFALDTCPDDSIRIGRH